MPGRLEVIRSAIVTCRACPRLVAWRERVAREKRAAYRDETYWGLPVPGFGDPAARVVILGLAPGAHGANRTGRIFTGDRSGDFLFAALHRAGFASQPSSTHVGDGLSLEDVFITCPVRCAPPDNRPLPDEFARCAGYLDQELSALPSMSVIVALGAFAWASALDHLGRCRGVALPRPRPKFVHGASVAVAQWTLLGSYHVSQQNTQTGRLTPQMFDEVLRRARRIAGRGGS